MGTVLGVLIALLIVVCTLYFFRKSTKDKSQLLSNNKHVATDKNGAKGIVHPREVVISSNLKTDKYSTVENAPFYNEFLNQALKKGIYASQDDCNSFLIEALKTTDYEKVSDKILTLIANQKKELHGGASCSVRLLFSVNMQDKLVVYSNYSGENRLIFQGLDSVTDMSAAAIMYRVYCDIFDYAGAVTGIKINRLSMEIDEYMEDYTKEEFSITYQIN